MCVFTVKTLCTHGHNLFGELKKIMSVFMHRALTVWHSTKHPQDVPSEGKNISAKTFDETCVSLCSTQISFNPTPAERRSDRFLKQIIPCNFDSWACGWRCCVISAEWGCATLTHWPSALLDKRLRPAKRPQGSVFKQRRSRHLKRVHVLTMRRSEAPCG